MPSPTNGTAEVDLGFRAYPVRAKRVREEYHEALSPRPVVG